MTNNAGLSMRYNGDTGLMYFYFTDSVTVNTGGWHNIRSFNKTYAPPHNLYFPTNNGSITIRINVGDGFVQAFNTSSSSQTTGMGFVVMYPFEQ